MQSSHISLKLSSVLTLSRISLGYVHVIFGASWKRKQYSYLKQIALLHEVLGRYIDKIYLVEISGSDLATEYFVDELGLTTTPSLVVFLKEKVVFTSSFPSCLSSESHIELRLLSFLREHSIQRFVRDITVSPLRAWFDQDNVDDSPLVAFIAGDKSQVGKSSVCLGLLASLVRAGVNPSSLAYIKPVTQCEGEQLVTKYCSRLGIACRGIGPVVFYQGFTRAFLQNETESSAVLLDRAVRAVHDISRGKRFVLVDGVGYPSVGSIVSLSNAHVSKALNIPVLLVGKAGVGDAVDSYNLNASYFESFGVKVLGGVFNKLPVDGFYNLEASKQAVTSYFLQYRSNHHVFGFIPAIAKDGNETLFEETFQNIFSTCFDVESLIFDLILDKCARSSAIEHMESISVATVTSIRHQNTISTQSMTNPEISTSSKKRGRHEIELEASALGARGG